MWDWHYGDEQGSFPAMAEMQSEGFRVIGATWKREQTTRISAVMPCRGASMV